MHDETATGRLGSVMGKHSPRVALLLMLTAQLADAQAIPVQASDAQVTDAGTLQYSLTSSAGQPATAWSVTVVVTDTNNALMHQSAITMDEYRAAESGIIPEEELTDSLLRPNRIRRFEVTGPFDPRLQVTVTPAAMVYLDGTSVGDLVLIERIFRRRVEERDARADMLRQLIDVRTHYVGRRALQEAIARLARSATPDPGHARQLCQKNLREALTRPDTGSIDPLAELSRQIEAVRREYAAAVRHATPARKED